MKITKYGVVIITHGGIKIEDWLVESEPSDPPEATKEQMLLEVTIPWAQKKLNAAILANLQRISREKKATQVENPTTASGNEVQ